VVTEEELPDALMQDEEEAGFVDLDFALVELESRADGSWLAIGLYGLPV
jgi:hypothetical protein